MDFNTVINIAQYVLSVLVLPALWFIVKLYNTVSLHTKDIASNKEAITEAKILEKERVSKLEIKDSKREDWEREIYKLILEQGKDIHYIKEQINK